MPSPYTLDLFAAIEADGRLDLRVLYMEMEAPDTRWGDVPLPESAEVLKGGWRNIAGGRIHWNPDALRRLRATNPDLVVIVGYSSLTTQIAMRWLRWNKIPWIFWGELPGMRKLGILKSQLRAIVRHPAIAWPNAIAAIGSVAVTEYRRLSKGRCDVSNIPYFTDLSHFLSQPRVRPNQAVRLLYCGQLIERKGLNSLLDAFLALADSAPELVLQFVGDGPLKSSLMARIPQSLSTRVEFLGFQPVEKLPSFFAAADIFVLPSKHDGWGVVVNQALGAGLPIICTCAVGAAHDLITSDWNGWVVPVDDVSALSEAIRRLVVDEPLRMQFGANSRSRAMEWGPDQGADRWVRLVTDVLQRRDREIGSDLVGEKGEEKLCGSR